MKALLVTIWGLSVLAASGQTVLTPSSPVLAPPAGVLVPSNPALTASPEDTNSTTTNLTAADLSVVLLKAQASLEQALPRLGLFNYTFSFAQVPFGTLPSANFSQNLGANFSRNLGQNFAQNLAVNLGSNLALPQLSQDGLGMPAAPSADTNTLTRETLGALLVLQADMERMLPLLNALNGTTNASATLTTNSISAGTATESTAQ